MRAAAFIVLFALSSAALQAQPAPVPKAALQEWSETIDYGIDSQIVDVDYEFFQGSDSMLVLKRKSD